MEVYSLSKEESERLSILKYISIVLVVYLHAYGVTVGLTDGATPHMLLWWVRLLENFVSQIIARCAVPIFYLISSVLLFKKQRKYIETIFGKIKTLLVPYFLWNSFWIFESALEQSKSISSVITTMMNCSFSEWMSLYGVGLDLPYPKDYPLWFIRDLMLVVLIFPIIGKIAKKYPQRALFVSALLLLVPVSFPLKQAVLWSVVGACVVNLQIHMTIFDGIAMWKLSLFYVLFSLITLMVDLSLVNTICIFLGIVHWIRVTKYIFGVAKIRACFMKLSKYTFIIYVTHELTLSTLKYHCMKRIPMNALSALVVYLLLPIAVIIGCSVAGMILKRLFPRMYSVLMGER